MKENVIKIALAGLLHDIGKLVQGCLPLSAEYRNNNADLYQPFKDGHHTHIHALYTAAFIEQFADKLPPQLNSADWGNGDILLNLAAKHHRPETPMQWIVTMADRISSGLDRAMLNSGDAIHFKDFKKTRLLPLFEKLGRETKGDSLAAHDWMYPLAPLRADTVFPVRKTRAGQAEADKEYQDLFDIFTEHLAKLRHRDSDIGLWLDHFDSLLKTCLAFVPAARAGKIVPDVSLYDHCRTTAGIASALYLYHLQTDTLQEQKIQDRAEKKFLLVTGDFYGIQKFIFASGGDVRKYRSKLLRGRSFAVSLFSELAADLLCDKIGLSSLSILFNAAGKFTLLAPNTEQARQAVQEVETSINDWLIDIAYGEASLGLAMTEACPEQFQAGEYGELHDRHMDAVHEKKELKINLEQYSGPVPGYQDSFNRGTGGLCGLCGKRPATEEASSDRTVLGISTVDACPVCRDHVLLGSFIVRNKWLAILDTPDTPSGQGLLAPIFARYQIAFTGPEAAMPSGRIRRLWQVNINEDGTLFSEVTMRPLNGYIPLYAAGDIAHPLLCDTDGDQSEEIREGAPKTFNHLARLARHGQESGGAPAGTEALGILKADVDNLALLMGCGLPEDQYTVTRLATLSRQLDGFFSIYLPMLLKNNPRFNNVYTVFAGGDDLFLIGPWNTVSSLALYLRQQFHRYVCENTGITFSAGITVHKPGVPVDRMALSAEVALEEAKQKPGKDSVSMFGQTVGWNDFAALLDKQQTMHKWLELGYISPAMMYRFNHLIELAGREKHVLAHQQVYMDDLDAMKWRAMFHYSVARNAAPGQKKDRRKEAMDEVLQMGAWMEQYGAATRIPLWHLLYDRR